ncbi:MAG: hypothetical protein ACJ8H8_05545 [Geminicoccaceae bacterium]|jgi:hypothetical protein
MSIQPEPTTVCESCGQPLNEAKATVVIQAGDGQLIGRHRRCHMLELLDRG